MENSNKVYDLEERTTLFAERVSDFCLKLPKNAANAEYIPQLIRAGFLRELTILRQMKA